MLMDVGPTKYGRIIPMFEERLRQLGSWLGVNGEAIYSTIPWSHQNDTLTDKVWYVSNISWCTYLEDNYIVFENITASIWDFMVANWVYWRRVQSTIVVVKCSNTIQIFPFKCNHVYWCALPHYWQDDVSDNRLKFKKYLMVFQPWKWYRAHYSIVQSQSRNIKQLHKNNANQWHREKYTYNFCLLFSLKLE